jgi:hypothetical protein
MEKIPTNNRPTSTDLKNESQLQIKKSTTLVLLLRIQLFGIKQTWPIFEKCSHIRDKGGVLTLRFHVWTLLTRKVACNFKCHLFMGLLGATFTV